MTGRTFLRSRGSTVPPPRRVPKRVCHSANFACNCCERYHDERGSLHGTPAEPVPFAVASSGATGLQKGGLGSLARRRVRGCVLGDGACGVRFLGREPGLLVPTQLDC